MRCVLVMLLSLGVSCGCRTGIGKDPTTRSASRNASVPDTVEVIALMNGKDGSQPIKAAQVFILDVDGRTVWSGLTDDQGIARLPYDDLVNRKPTLILVEKDLMYIAGLRWRESAREYRILLAPVAMY